MVSDVDPGPTVVGGTAFFVWKVRSTVSRPVHDAATWIGRAERLKNNRRIGALRSLPAPLMPAG
jgi:hypothetical protein